MANSWHAGNSALARMARPDSCDRNGHTRSLRCRKAILSSFSASCRARLPVLAMNRRRTSEAGGVDLVRVPAVHSFQTALVESADPKQESPSR